MKLAGAQRTVQIIQFLHFMLTGKILKSMLRRHPARTMRLPSYATKDRS